MVIHDAKRPNKGVTTTDRGSKVAMDVVLVDETGAPTGLTVTGVEINATGLATEAKQDTIITSLASIDTVLDEIDANTDAVEGKLDTIATHVDGVETKLDAANTSLDNIEAATVVGADIKYAPIAASSSGQNTIVAGVTSKKIRVLGYVITASAAVNAKFRTGASTDITGLLYMSQSTGASAAVGREGYFETASGEALTLNLSAAVAVGGHIAYQEV